MIFSREDLDEMKQLRHQRLNEIERHKKERHQMYVNMVEKRRHECIQSIKDHYAISGQLPDFPYECKIEFLGKSYGFNNNDFEKIKSHYGSSIEWRGPIKELRTDCDDYDGCYKNNYIVFSGTFKTLN